MILESDGHSTQAPFQALATKMAESKITVSTVALGAGADDKLLRSIAAWGKGRAYFVPDATSIPQVFSEEAEEATGNTLREQPFKPVAKKNVQLFRGIDFETGPELLGYVATKAKETAEVLLESPERKDPVLARGSMVSARPRPLRRREGSMGRRVAPLGRLFEILVATCAPDHENARRQRIVSAGHSSRRPGEDHH